MLKNFLTPLILLWCAVVNASQIITVGDVDYARLDPEVLALIAKANNNDQESQARLADSLLDGRGLKKDIPESIKWFTELANKQDGYAAFALSIIYQYGIGVEQNLDLSANYYKKGLKNSKVAINMRNIALHQNNPNSSLYNVGHAIEWFTKSADNGNLFALNDLAEIYLYGDSKFRDTVKALKYYGKSAASGSSYAKYAIGTIYYDGKGGIEKDKKEAYKWILKAATQGFSPAQYRLAQMYLQGDGVVRDEVEAYAWLSVANKSLLFNQAELQQKNIAKNLVADDLQEAITLAKEYNVKFTA